MIIKYNNIKLKKRELLKEGKIEIGNNGCYVLKGKNGCGKSLWLRRVHLSLGTKSVYVAQNNDMHINNESVIYNISLSRNVTDNEIIRKELKDVGLEFLLDLKIKKMSGGEKRLVSLLRGIYSNKGIVMLDEPLNDLDYIYANKIIELVKKMKEQVLFIVITHDDRFDKIADGYLKFENGSIVTDILKKEQDNIKDKKNEFKKIDIFLKKSKGVCISFLLLLSMSVVYCSLFKMTLSMNNDTEKLVLGSNQVNIYVPASSIGADMGVYGAFPLHILHEIMSADINEVEKIVSDVELKYSRENRTKLTSLFENKGLKMYPLEYYDYENRQYCNTIQIYLAEKKYDAINDAVRTMPMFLNWTNDKGNNVIDFQEKDFNKIVNRINSEEKYEIVYMTLVLDENMEMEDFLELEEVKELAKQKDVYIQTNDTINIYSNVMKTMEQSEFIKRIMLYAVLIGTMDVGIYILLLRRKRKRYMLFANMGVQKAVLKKKVDNSISYYILLIIWGAVNVALSMVLKEKYNIDNTVMIYLPCICMIVIFIIVVIMKSRLLSREIDRAYKWNKR